MPMSSVLPTQNFNNFLPPVSLLLGHLVGYPNGFLPLVPDAASLLSTADREGFLGFAGQYMQLLDESWGSKTLLIFE